MRQLVRWITPVVILILNVAFWIYFFISDTESDEIVGTVIFATVGLGALVASIIHSVVKNY